MTVSDEQAATLRAFLKGDFDEYERLNARLDRDADGAGLGALVASGFFEAVDRKFGSSAKDAEVIEFMSEVRSRSDRASAVIDPKVAERLIRSTFGEESVADLDDTVVGRTQLMLLAALISDEELDDVELDNFIVTARAFGDRLMS
jgi:hypothetical protein